MLLRAETPGPDFNSLGPFPQVMEIEITDIPPLAPGQDSLIEMHSVLNVLNVLSGELTLIGMRTTGNPSALKGSLAICQQITAALTDRQRALEEASRIDQFESATLREIAVVRETSGVKASDPRILESLENLASIFHILRIRAQELLARAKMQDPWYTFKLDEIRDDVRMVFAAIEKNSHGRYHVVYNLARQLPTDYLISFAIESANGTTVVMPHILRDVLRDLIANARKYTKVGGSLMLGLFQTATELKLVVSDTGCGIPPDEITKVVHFGERGSNVREVRTMGGGFGLTKAFLVTKRFGGRMWIHSELNVGTRITLKIPRPASGSLPPVQT